MESKVCQIALGLFQKIQQLFLNLNYYHTYYETLTCISTGHIRSIVRIEIRIVLMKLGILYAAFLAVYQDSLSPVFNVALYNVPYLMNLSANYNTLLCLFVAFAIELYKILYNENINTASKWMKRILIDGDHEYFIWPYYKNGQLRFRLLNQAIVMWVRSFAIAIKAGSNIGYALHPSLRAYFQLEVNRIYLEQRESFDYPIFWLLLVLFLVVYIFHIAFTLFMTHAFILASNLVILALVCFTIRLHQVNYFVQSVQPQLFDEHRLARFLQFNVLSLRCLDDGNTVYGRGMFWGLLLCMPTSAVFVMILLLTEQRLLIQTLIILALVLGFFMMFILHYFAVMLSIKFHKPAKQMIKVLLESKRMTNKRARFKLICYVEQFHTTNPYSLTYGKFGSVNFQSFGRHLFYYVKMLFLCYNILSNTEAYSGSRFKCG